MDLDIPHLQQNLFIIRYIKSTLIEFLSVITFLISEIKKLTNLVILHLHDTKPNKFMKISKCFSMCKKSTINRLFSTATNSPPWLKTIHIVFL